MHSIDVHGNSGKFSDGFGSREQLALKNLSAILAMAWLAMSVAACSTTVKMEAPKEPIRIDLNVKIDQEVRIRLDDEVENLIDENPDLF